MPPKGKYTDPKLRDQVKEEIQNSDKGGQPGQWSARKAQMMASEYKKRGGDYTTDKKDKDESQQNLTKWGEEDWQTKDGEGKAKQEDGTEKRYLPKKAWENMSEKEKEETDQKKQEASKEGKQHVENTSKAKESRRKATKDDDGKSAPKAKDGVSKAEDQKKEANGNASNGRSSRSQTKKAQEESEQSNEAEDDGKSSKKGGKAKETEAKQDEKEEKEEKDEEEEEGEGEEQPKNKSTRSTKAGQKRKSTSQQQNDSSSSSKKQKDNNGNKATIGSKHMDATEPAQKGSADRLPKKGQRVTWKAMPGYVEGTVMEIVKKSKKVDGKQVKASESDPKIVLESEKSGKICVHKPEACFYDDE